MNVATIDTAKMMTTTQFAERLGDNTKPDTIRKYCSLGIIKAELIGRSWLISEAEYARYTKHRRPPGRPTN